MESPLRSAVDDGTRLIETFGWVPGQGVARQALHLARLERSARALGFGFDKAAVVARIAGIGGAAALRCRLTLGAQGDVALETFVMPAAADVPWVFRIAPERVRSGDECLRHKTTRRAVYDKWRATLPEGVMEMVFLNERGEVCEGTITNIVITTPEGDQLTPPLMSGCLPGVFRQDLLNNGLLREAVLTLADLRDAADITLVNALRGAIHARWDPECAAQS